MFGSPSIASLLGRPDTYDPGNVAVSVPPSMTDTAGSGVQFAASLQGGGSALEGRVALGMLASLVVGLVAFYWWTRGHQL